MIVNTTTSLPYHGEDAKLYTLCRNLPTTVVAHTSGQEFLTEEEVNQLLANFPLEETTSFDSTTDDVTPPDSSPASSPHVMKEKRSIADKIAEVREGILYHQFKTSQFPAFCQDLSSCIDRLYTDLTILLKTPALISIGPSKLSEALKRALNSLMQSCNQYCSSHCPYYYRALPFRTRIKSIIRKIDYDEYMSEIQKDLGQLYKAILQPKHRVTCKLS